MVLMRDDPSQLHIPDGVYEMWNYQSLPGRTKGSIKHKAVYFGNKTIQFCESRSMYDYKLKKMNNIATFKQRSEC